MVALIQRVLQASVAVDGESIASIDRGLLVLIGVAHGDTQAVADSLVRKISALRIFNDAAGKMNHSLVDIDGEALVVSQFTLLADTRKGNRPSFVDAAKPEIAKELYEYFAKEMEKIIDDQDNFTYLTAVEVSAAKDLPHGFATRLVEDTEYAVFRHDGHVSEIRKTISEALEAWFPKSAYRPAQKPMLERYGPGFNVHTGLGDMEVWIAVERST